MLHRPSAGDVLYGAVMTVFTFAAARVWWLSTVLPCMDHSQFLVFVRATRDYADPSSPFHGTYAVGPWYMPTTLPIHLVGLAWRLLPGVHPLEQAGKLLLGLQNVSLVAACAYLLYVSGRPRWAVVLVFPLVHSRWSVVGGYTVFATSMPLVVLGWALTVRFFRRLDLAGGGALAVCLSATLLWHGIGYVVLGMGFAVLWFLWRPRSVLERALGALPAVPSLLQCAVWLSGAFGQKPGPKVPASWMKPLDALDSVVEYVWTSVPHARGLAFALGALVCVGLAVCPTNVGPPRWAGRMWRFGNPFLAVSLVYLAAYFLLPMQIRNVEGVASRFAYPAALAFVCAWNLPGGRLAGGLLVASVLAFSAFCIEDVAERFRAFDRDTRGASALVDRLGPHETLYYFPTDRGASKDFAADHVPLRELQQYSTIREGGLPNSSFAGYGYNPVRYVGDRNPMPGLTGPARAIPEMRRFDYVLARRGQGPRGDGFKAVGSDEGWELYAVCGSARFPRCDAPMM